MHGMDPHNPDDSKDAQPVLTANRRTNTIPRLPLGVAGVFLVVAILLPLALSATQDPGFSFVAMMLALIGVGAALTVGLSD